VEKLVARYPNCPFSLTLICSFLLKAKCMPLLIHVVIIVLLMTIDVDKEFFFLPLAMHWHATIHIYMTDYPIAMPEHSPSIK
jgi:hypothetical protein